MEPKNKAARTLCYNARDAYFDCIGDQKATNIDKSICPDLYQKFEELCGKNWTKHFLGKHDYEIYKKKLYEEGTDSVDKKKLDL